MALAPGVALAEVPGVRFDDRREGLQGPLELQVAIQLGAPFGPAHLLIELRAFGLRTPALLAGLAAECGGGDFDPHQPIHPVFGLGRRPLADGQRGDFLHGGGLRTFLRQSQPRVGWTRMEPNRV